MGEMGSKSLGSQDQGQTSLRKEYQKFYNFVKGGNDGLVLKTNQDTATPIDIGALLASVKGLKGKGNGKVDQFASLPRLSLVELPFIV